MRKIRKRNKKRAKLGSIRKRGMEKRNMKIEGSKEIIP